MRVLLIKTSSMGDLIHTLPALTDAKRAIPDIEFDWMVEESFAAIPSWHPAVRNVIPLALRRWRKNLVSSQTRSEWRAFRNRLKSHSYDLILDAQGLTKSAFLSFLAKGKRVGLDFSSAREPIASIAYQKKCHVNFYQHAIVRMRQLFSQALDYPMPATSPDFNLTVSQFESSEKSDVPYLVFLHGTTWDSKQWPEEYWEALANLSAKEGFRIKISGGSDAEVARARRLAEKVPSIDAVPRIDLLTMAKYLVKAKAVVAVDTGFGHLAAALGVPTVSLYGSTNPDYTSAIGDRSLHLAAQFPCSPCLNRECQYKKPSVVTPACYATLPPEMVWEKVKAMMRNNEMPHK
jgi:heptosyltransferase-1